MAYLVLARKYRPGSFEEVVGQEHVTRTLRNAIKSGRLGHAFMFSGLRGVGKTSVARILAKTLNCESPPEPDHPCGTCGSCSEVDEGRSLNVVEMDAASHTSVDDIRDLREGVMYAPGEGKYKVYIIDEVHMLSKSAFNALLKTLEEPPPRVVFILATTEPHKVPVTIHSRCQKYDFRRIPSAAIAGHLGMICEKEGVDISPDSLRRIAIASEGSLRDSQSLLDQILSYAGDSVSEEDVNIVLGSLDRGLLLAILEATFGGLSGEALQVAGQMIDGGADPLRIALDLIGMMRSLLLMSEMEDFQGVLDLPEGEVEPMKRLAEGMDKNLHKVRFSLLVRAEERMRRSPQPRFHLELAIVHMANAHEIVPAAGAGGGNYPAAAPRPADPSPAPDRTSNRKPPEPQDSVPPQETSAPAFAAIETKEETWEKLISFVNGKAPNIGSMLEHLVCLKIAGSELLIGGRKGEIYLEVLGEREKQMELADLVSEFFTREMKVRLSSMDSEDRVRKDNIIEKKEKKESDLARKIRKETLEHQAVKNALDIFQGEVETVRVLAGKTPESLDVQEKEEEA